jgi:hypothetical protein
VNIFFSVRWRWAMAAISAAGTGHDESKPSAMAHRAAARVAGERDRRGVRMPATLPESEGACKADQALARIVAPGSCVWRGQFLTITVVPTPTRL